MVILQHRQATNGSRVSKSTQQVSEIAKVCNKYKIPMIPYSGGSSLEANFSAPYGGISIDFAHMDKVIEVRPDDLDVTVQPAVGWMSLNEQIRETGLFFPVDPGPTAMIGGMVGTSCSGTNAVRYGTMRDWIINLTVVLVDGTVIKAKRRPRKTAAGYNLNHLFVGSEGTLGIVTEVTLKLTPIPQQTSVAVVTFPTIADAASTAQKVIRAGIPVGAMEIMDEVSMSVVNKVGRTKRQWDERPSLFFKFVGTPTAVKEHAEQVKAIAKSQRSRSFETASNEVHAADLWSARKENLWSMLSLRRPDSGDCVWPTDYAVPISRLPDLIAGSKSSLEKNAIFATCLGHIGDGNFHETILYDASDPAIKKAVVEHVKRVTAMAIEMEGTSTGEHGIGMSKKDDLVEELGEETVDVMRKIKKALDPDGLMNPGKIFD
ncbi:D-lactate dehydrogenase [cytochrome], mitochondrial [Pseudocercospora fuligena]|uniref:D-lactate dehydrogenase (cytochrome) n=1 Tax=Pseudocercospora fuligena TaxID=685502 RepID=A0A8H6VNN6_9PEZI|nr:D-lactate dehydrogenase [cytochrome], mitochondrial [Pseudocercospora fuligena]